MTMEMSDPFEECLDVVPDAAHAGGWLGSHVAEAAVLGGTGLADAAIIEHAPGYAKLALLGTLQEAVPPALDAAHEAGDRIGGGLAAFLAYEGCVDAQLEAADFSPATDTGVNNEPAGWVDDTFVLDDVDILGDTGSGNIDSTSE